MGSWYGGRGGYTSGNIIINKSSSLYVYVGQKPADLSLVRETSPRSGSWNGGGVGGYNDTRSHGYTSASGGGATDVRVTSGAWNNAASLRSRIMVAGAGGGGVGDGWQNGQGVKNGELQDAGGLTGYYGAFHNSGNSNGGTQTAGGNAVNIMKTNAECVALNSSSGILTTNATSGGFGYGGNGSYSQDAWTGGGGGSGWYGGAGGMASCKHWAGVSNGGGGGSSYISGYTGSVAVASTSSSSPKSGCTTGTTNNACSITPYVNPVTNAGYTFSSTQMIAGNASMPNTAGTGNETGHSGSGYAKRTWLGDTI